MNRTTWSGEAVVKRVGAERVAIVLDTNADGSIDRGYAVRLDEPVELFAPIRFASVHVEERPGYIRIVGDQRVIEFIVPDADVTPAPVPPGFAVQRFVGYELLTNSGETNRPIHPARSRVATDAADCQADGTGCYDFDETWGDSTGGSAYPSCNNGGSGAIQCSASGVGNSTCSVTCISGYFACCNHADFSMPRCRCVKY